MARAEAIEDSDNESQKSLKKITVGKDKESAVHKDAIESEGASGPSATGSEGESEEEYEIEAILDAKRGAFSNGRYGYLVKWKNYPTEHNSWVDEQDAGNAHDLITAYWKKNKKEVRKSIDAKPKSRRKSTVADDSEAGSTSVAKKRGRPKASATKDTSDDEQERGIKDEPAPKKPRKLAAKTHSAKKPKAPLSTYEQDDEDDDMDGVVLKDMDEFMSIPSWEDIVDAVDTVEQTKNGDLQVYFKLKSDGSRVLQPSRVCAQKFPQKMIQFYESNLRWKTGEINATEDP